MLPRARPVWGRAGAGGSSPSVGRALGAGLRKGSPVGSTVPGQGHAAPAGGPAWRADLASPPFVPFPFTGTACRKELGKPRW